MTTPTARRTGAAVEAAVGFLEGSQLPSGEVPATASGVRDPAVFPTALAAHCLAADPRAATLRDRALDFLERHMQPGGLWKHWTSEHPHHHQLPPDVDDTACASAALRAAGRHVPDNTRLLLRNRDRRGLLRTWVLGPGQLRHPLVTWAFFTKTSARPGDVDAVVNANALHHLGPLLPAAVDHLLAVLREDREAQCDKWYDDPFAVWYFFSRALHPVAPQAEGLLVAKLERATPTSALQEALRVCALRYWGRVPDPGPLLEMQLPTGAWPAAPLYTGGRPRLRSGGFGPSHPDTPRWGSEELTTAFCVEALGERA